MKTIDEILAHINEFQDAPLPGDYSEYESSMENVKNFLNENSFTVDFAVCYFEKLHKGEENCAEKEKFRLMLCCVSYIFIQELLNLGKYVEALLILETTFKKYVISPYMDGEIFQEMNHKAGVLDFDEVKIWDNYNLSIFQYVKGFLPSEKILDLLNIAIDYRNNLLQDLEHPTGYEPVFYELKKLKIELSQTNIKTQVKAQVKTTLSKDEYDEKLLRNKKKYNMLDSIPSILYVIGNNPKFEEQFFKDSASFGVNNNYMSYELYLTILTQQLSEMKRQYEFLGQKKQKNKMETQFYTILKQKIDYQYSYIFFVFLKSIQHYLQNKKDQNAQYIFINNFHIILSGFDFIKSEKVDFSKVITFFQEYFYESLSQEEKSKLIDLSSYK